MRRLDVNAAAAVDDDSAIVVLRGIICIDGPYSRYMCALVEHLAGESELRGETGMGCVKHVLAEMIRLGLQRAISLHALSVFRVVVGELDGGRNPRI